jgi:hypothetical protein
MNKLNISINLLGLQGASLITSKAGTECVVIDLSRARATKHANGKVYLNLEAKENRDGVDRYGNTHFVAEPTTKDERQGGLKLPIIGNGKVFTFEKRPQGQQDAPKRQETAKAEPEIYTDANGDDIPF